MAILGNEVDLSNLKLANTGTNAGTRVSLWPNLRQPDPPKYNPDLPVYAAPDTPYKDVAIGEDKRATVAGQMGILGRRDSDWSRMNEAKGTAEGMKRGLLNTTMSGEMGIKAGLEAMVPIAQQDAKLFGDAATNNQVAQLEHNKMLTNAQLTGALAQQDYAGKFKLAQQDYAGKFKMQEMSDAAQLQRVEVDNRWKQAINFDNLHADQRKSLMGLQGQLGAELTGGIERILRDTNIANKTAAIKSLMTIYQSQLNTAAAIIGIKLTW